MTDTPPPEFPPPTGFPPPGVPTGPPPPPTGSTLPPPPPSAEPPPPGYYSQQAGYGFQAGPGGVARPLGGLATALTVLLILAALANVGFAFALFNRASVLDTNFDFQEISDADDAVAGTVALVLLAFLVNGILWIIWQFRHAKNAELLGKRDGLGAGWAIGGWFIPLGNLVLPQLQLTQSAQASDPDVPGGKGRTPPVVVVWWVLFVLQGVVGFASGRYTDDEIQTLSDIDDFQATDRLAGFGALVTAAAAIAAILAVRALSARQQRALHARGVPG